MTPHETASITIASPSQDEVLTYPLAIIRGYTSLLSGSIYISCPTHPPSLSFPIREGAFIALFLLCPGQNRILLSESPSLTNPAILQLSFCPPPSTHPHVRLIYLLASDSDGAFQSPSACPHDSSLASGTARLETAGLLIQSAAAEMMRAQNLQRRTFQLAPSVQVHRLPITTSDAYKKTGNELWSLVQRHFANIPNRNDIIDLVVMSFTRMTPSGVQAHTALGGGNLALFGGGSVFTWPETLREIPTRLLDPRTFDSRTYFDDSANRMKDMGRRACAATTIGALLHELGHCFSLPHPCGDAAEYGGGIMARGFDWLDRLFVQSNEGQPFWDRGSALRLRYHRFFRLEGEPDKRRVTSLGLSPSPTPQPKPRTVETAPPQFERDGNGYVVCCHSECGIGHIGYYRNGDNAAHEEFQNGTTPKTFRLPAVVQVMSRCHASRTDKLVISAIDIDGRISETPFEDTERVR